MDYARFDNQAPPNSWNNPADSAQALPMQAQQLPPQSNIKPDPTQHSQAQPIVYGPPHQPMAGYDMPQVSWTPQMVPQNVIQVPQWSTASTAPVGHSVAIDPNGPPPPVSDPCLHPSTAPPQQSHYTHYSTLQAPTYWNTDLVSSQPATLASLPPTTATTITVGSMPDLAAANDPTLIDSGFQLNQPNVSSALQPGPMPESLTVAATAAAVVPPPPPPTQQPSHTQYDDQLAISTSSQVEQLPLSMPDGPGSLEDALEVIKSHAEHFSGHRQTCSSTSGDDDDDHSRGQRSGEREKERRQANNARER